MLGPLALYFPLFFFGRPWELSIRYAFAPGHLFERFWSQNVVEVGMGRCLGTILLRVWCARTSKCIVFLWKMYIFQKIVIFHSKRDLGMFSSLGGRSGSFLAPNSVSLGALELQGMLLGCLQDRWDSSKCLLGSSGPLQEGIWAHEGVPGHLGTSFWAPCGRFSWFYYTFPNASNIIIIPLCFISLLSLILLS